MQRIDFNKLDTVALKRYRRIHKLDDVGSNPTKEELVSAVGKHFTAQVCGLALMGLFSVLSTLAAVWPVSKANVQPVETSCISLFSVLSILAGMWTMSKANTQPAETTTNFFTAETTTWLLFSCNALRSLQIAVSCSSPCAQLTSVTAVTVAVPSAGCGREQSHSHVCPCSSQESGCCSLTSLNICNVP